MRTNVSRMGEEVEHEDSGKGVRLFFLALTFFALSGLGPVLIHHDVYDARKAQERAAFEEFAIPPGAEEIRDDSFEKFKQVVLIKTYKVNIPQDELEKYYREKLEAAGWKRGEVKEGIQYTRNNLWLHITFESTEVRTWLSYRGPDNDC